MNKRWITRLLPLILVFVLISSSIKTANANFNTDLPPPDDAYTSTIPDETDPNYIIAPWDPDQDSEISAHVVNGSPHPPAGYETTLSRSPNLVSAAKALSNFPSYSWVYGCGAVSAAMIAAYYDRNGFPNMYTGPTNGGMMPLTDTAWPTWVDSSGTTYPSNPLIASQRGVDGRLTRGTIDNYWVSYQSLAPDPYITHSWSQHAWGTAIGDFIKTSQSEFGNYDGQSVIYLFSSAPTKLTCDAMETFTCSRCNGRPTSTCDITYGRKLFYKARGYTVTDCYNQVTDNVVAGGFSFSDFKAEIDAGHPVFIQIRDQDRGHFMVGYGYSGNNILIRDTWDSNPNNTYSMRWGGSYHGMEMRSVGIVRPQAAGNQAPTNIFLSNNRVIDGQPVNTFVGTFSTADPNPGDTHTYALVSGTGSTDNGAFKIQGNQLLTAQAFDAAVKNTYNIRVRSTDQGNLSYEKPFTILINPTSNQHSIFLPLIHKP